MARANVKISKKVFNEIYLEKDLLNNQDRYLVLMGGGGSGKSVFAAQKIIIRMMKESHPTYKHRFLVLRKVQNTLRGSVFEQFKSVINKWNLGNLFQIPKGRSSELYIRCKNGNEIIFAGLDDVEKLKSIVGITGIWLEEASEMDAEDFRQLDIRLRDKTIWYKQIIISFNPISVTHWLKAEFFDHKKKNSTTLRTTYKDNKFLEKEQIDVLEGFKETDPYYYTVYALGEWGVVGKTIFDAQKVSERIAYLRDKKPIKQGFFIFDYKNEKIIDSTIKWVDDPNGQIKIYKDKVEQTPYVLGGDTAGDGSDFFAGHILNNITGEQVATIHHQTDEDLFAKQAYCLGKHYNEALISLEVNFSTYPVKELQRLGYYRQFKRETIDEISKKKQHKFGFRTDRMSRPVIIAELVKIVREHVELINDIDTLNEMLTFVRNENGKPEAQEGKHDDLIISLAIAHKAREQQLFEPIKEEKLVKNPNDYDHYSHWEDETGLEYHEDGEGYL
ncbi:PBSX family phage terminase large subunit [Bacillus sp. DTU_2020_1000418_1_SI_GHA_SEK_038]|uniref:PBSX family phage terminase large subunit n=1 Tax=Bacillus sp. DTU_2020_1000418_1_SI_GHA_SEK_038 TaxID=3077585 RepID=UPI0028EAEF1B|nr:PBSX family phage terminase large subunit [Bacillus sp. DTU_2020_1000418_1_SI_GHA_SEK_038]WNS74244.1 PBSX family phage terminase large subunit [Bacillus sp. DTU_2020_1000418_1_SI_GHA_SEK_038]